MTDEIGLVVKVRTKAVPGQLDRLKNDVNGAVKQGAQAAFATPAPIKGFLSEAKGMGAPAGGTGGGGGSGGPLNGIFGPSPGGGRGAGGSGSLVGLFAGWTIILQGVLQGIQKMVGILVQSSPMLAATVGLLKTGLDLYLRPIGDAIGRFLRPIAMAMIDRSIENLMLAEAMNQEIEDWGLNETWTGILQFMSQAGMAQVQITYGFLQLIASVADGMGQAVIWFGTAISDFMVGVFGSISSTLGGIGEWLWGVLTGGLGAITGGVSGIGSWLWETITSGLGGINDHLLGIPGWLWEQITGGLGELNKLLGGIPGWLWDQMRGAFQGGIKLLDGLGQWLWRTLTDALGGLGAALAGIGGEAYKVLHNVLASIPNAIRNVELPLVGKPFTFIPEVAYLAEGGVITGPTHAVIGEKRRPEVVLPLDRLETMLGGRAPSTNVVNNYHGPFYGVADIERAWDDYMRRYMSRTRRA